MHLMKEYKKIIIFLICIAVLRIFFVFLGGSYGYFSFSNLFTSVLSTGNIASLTNDSRKVVGLPELEVNTKLQAAAQKKAEDMMKSQYFSHVSPAGKTAWDFMNENNYQYLFAGENLAINFKSAEDVTAGWLASISHKENILNEKYTQIGIGVTTGKFLGADSTIVVQIFGKPLRSGARMRTISSTVKRSKTITNPKSLSVKKYISKSVQNNVATWMPSAKTHEIYAVSEQEIPTKSILDTFFLYIVAGSAGIFALRYKLRN